MEKEKAIDVFNKWMDCKDAYQADPSCDGKCLSCEYYASAEEEKEAMALAISALEKQEQTNAQSVNSMRTSRPNALESLNILEQAKDDKGNVPMSLVRQAFRNVMEQDRWIPVTERLPEKEGCYLVTVKNDHERRYSKTAWYSGDGWFARQDIIAWRLTPEPYTEEEA